MIVYTFYIIILAMCAYISLFSKRPRFLIAFMLAIIFLFTAFRNNIGVDTGSYQEIFQEFQSGQSLGHIETGYKSILYFVSLIGGHFVLVQIICTGFSLFLIYQFIKDSVSVRFIGFGLFALVCSLTYLSYLCSGVRQGLAISVCLFCSRYIINHQFLKFVIGIGVAMLFHTSAIIFLPAYFIKKRKLNLILIFGMFVISYCAAPFIKILFDNVIGMVTGHYMGYVTLFNGDANSKSGLGIIVRLLIWTLVIIVYHSKLSDNEKDKIIYFNIFIVGVCLYLLNRNVDILNRFNEYYLSFFIVIFPLSIKAFKLQSKKLYAAFSSIPLIGLFISFILFVKDAFIPYKSYLTLL